MSGVCCSFMLSCQLAIANWESSAMQKRPSQMCEPVQLACSWRVIVASEKLEPSAKSQWPLSTRDSRLSSALLRTGDFISPICIF